MNSFVVSSRKYRPHLFAEIKGQQHVVATLRNAVKKKQVAQAFLFCGLKGSGKTTSARILAQAINCEQVTVEGEPCQTCLSCQQFRNQKSLNIHELDAASHNSAEDMRQIVEQMRFHPPGGKKTVIIIDEAHMLSNAALNVLLKPLEDTPPHIVFMLITTEKHKIIPTIISRCQTFEFHSIEQKDIIAQLNYVAQQENITAESAVFELISEKSGGSLRDALSMFDLLVTSRPDQNITYQQALQQLHLVDEKTYFDITNGIEQGDIEKVLLTYDQVMRLGFDGQQFLTGWSQHLRNLLVAKTSKTLPLLKVATHLKKQYSQEASRISKEFLYQILAVTHEASLHYKNSLTPRLYMELVLIKAAQVNHQEASIQPKVKQKAVNKPYQYTGKNEYQEVAEPATPYNQSSQKRSITPSAPQPITNEKVPQQPKVNTQPISKSHQSTKNQYQKVTNPATPHSQPNQKTSTLSSAPQLATHEKNTTHRTPSLAQLRNTIQRQTTTTNPTSKKSIGKPQEELKNTSQQQTTITNDSPKKPIEKPQEHFKNTIHQQTTTTNPISKKPIEKPQEGLRNTIQQEPITTNFTPKKPIENTKALHKNAIEALTKEKIMPHWQNFSTKLKQKRSKASTLFNLPISIENNSIFIEIHNPLHQQSLLPIHEELVAYLREKSGNTSLLVSTKLVTTAPASNRPKILSPQDKLRKLVTQNPAIANLQKKLDLTLS